MNYSEIDIRDAFFDEIYNIAAKDKNVIFITADADAFSLNKYRNDFPSQFINVGVAEQNMVTIAAGLALSGKKVFIYAIIPFIAMRCYEHIKVNLCSMNLPVTIIGIGAGLSFGYDGPTHHAMQDIAVMCTLPEITIFNPSDSVLSIACARLSYESKTPVYVRLDKGKFPVFYSLRDNFADGFKVIRKTTNINIITTGFMTHRAIEISEKLLKENNINIGVIDIYRIKPINEDLLLKTIQHSEFLISLEENSLLGGVGTLINEILSDNRINIPLKRIALKDKQLFDYGSREWLHAYYGLDVKTIIDTLLEEVSNGFRD